MAAHVAGIFDENLRNNLKSCKVLMVGAGGIGCELLKNLVLTGFEDLEIIDLDTIDVSNLNRQFLFQKQHVGRSKSQVARESALNFNPKAKITAYHESIMLPKYGTSFYKQFKMVLNALDNRAARNHVNRMCLAAGVPLVESGTAGYLGQVTVISKGLTECYECQPKPTQKTFPGCTIRNTPSELIHCIVWSKHLFNQLFGEYDADEDVSPDTTDPEQVGDAGANAASADANSDGNVTRTSTRHWAAANEYNAKKIFTKLFNDDIKYLLSMDKLWEKRRAPQPLDFENMPDPINQDIYENVLADQRILSLAKYRDSFTEAIASLYKRLKDLKEGDHLVWDKDDEDSMDFVTSCANIRATVFNIPQKSKFDIKSMAGNIIPAIATTNAIIAGLIVLEALKVLQGKIKDCKTVYLNRKPNPRKRLLVPCVLDKPNPKCYVCAEKPEIALKLNVETTTVKTLEDRILKAALNMVAPDVEVIDGKGTILISSEEGETSGNNDKFLKDFSIVDGTQLNCDDYMQEFTLFVTIVHTEEKLDSGAEFEVVGDPEQLKKDQEAAANAKEANSNEDGATNSTDVKTTSTVPDDDDLILLESDVTVKRKAEEEIGNPAKKAKKSADDDDIITL